MKDVDKRLDRNFAKVYTNNMNYNKEKAKQLLLTAERSIKIVRMILAGDTDQDIVIKLACNRQLIGYYRKQLTK